MNDCVRLLWDIHWRYRGYGHGYDGLWLKSGRIWRACVVKDLSVGITGSNIAREPERRQFRR